MFCNFSLKLNMPNRRGLFYWELTVRKLRDKQSSLWLVAFERWFRCSHFKVVKKFDNLLYFNILGMGWWAAQKASIWYRGLSIYGLNRTCYISCWAWMETLMFWCSSVLLGSNNLSQFPNRTPPGYLDYMTICLCFKKYARILPNVKCFESESSWCKQFMQLSTSS